MVGCVVTWPSPEMVALRDAIAAWAKEDPRTDFGEESAREVFAAASLTFTDEQFTRAALEFRRLPFYGGNYTLDARRVLKAAWGAHR